MNKLLLCITLLMLLPLRAHAQRTILIKNDGMMAFEVFGGGYNELQPTQQVSLNYSNPQNVALEHRLACKTSHQWHSSCGFNTWQGYQEEINSCAVLETNRYVIRLSCGK